MKSLNRLWTYLVIDHPWRSRSITTRFNTNRLAVLHNVLKVLFKCLCQVSQLGTGMLTKHHVARAPHLRLSAYSWVSVLTELSATCGSLVHYIPGHYLHTTILKRACSIPHFPCNTGLRLDRAEGSFFREWINQKGGQMSGGWLTGTSFRANRGSKFFMWLFLSSVGHTACSVFPSFWTGYDALSDLPKCLYLLLWVNQRRWIVGVWIL